MDDRNQDTWSDLQAFKSRQNSLRVKLQRRKKQREHIVLGLVDNEPVAERKENAAIVSRIDCITEADRCSISIAQIEAKLLHGLCDAALKLPVDSRLLLTGIRKTFDSIEKTDHSMIVNLLEKFAHQGLIEVIKDSFTTDGETCIIVSTADHSKLIEFSQQSLFQSNGHDIGYKEHSKSVYFKTI